MDPKLKFSELSYISTHSLLPLLKDVAKPYDWISQRVKKGELIRLKNGYFIVAEKIEKSPVPFEQIANLLYGPSYISFEWALSYYEMIPEGVFVVTSASATRTKSFKTPLGVFDYIYISHNRYAKGICQRENNAGRFLIATPEKALADVVHFKSNSLNSRELLVDLIEGKRIEEGALKQLDKRHLSEIAENYRSRAVTTLVKTLGLL